MVLFIIIAIIVFYVLINNLGYSNRKLLEISKSLTGVVPMPFRFPMNRITNRREFIDTWNEIVDEIYSLDRGRNSFEVNQWAYYTVKYYTQFVLQYGSYVQKSALKNFVRLLEMNHLIR